MGQPTGSTGRQERRDGTTISWWMGLVSGRQKVFAKRSGLPARYERIVLVDKTEIICPTCVPCTRQISQVGQNEERIERHTIETIRCYPSSLLAELDNSLHVILDLGFGAVTLASRETYEHDHEPKWVGVIIGGRLTLASGFGNPNVHIEGVMQLGHIGDKA